MPSKIYLDNACTSHPKPEVLWQAVRDYQLDIGASPARSGHTLGKLADEVISETRQLLADLFHADDSRKIVFAQNSTLALNTLIKGAVSPGDHVITTNLEHNSVLRPLENLSRSGEITYTVVESDNLGLIDPIQIEKAFQPNTKLVVVNHASNAIGVVSPIAEIGRVTHQHGALFMIDASQTAGVLPIDVTAQQIDMLAFTGHKSLYGPSGIGGAYINDADNVKTLIEGGSGNSKSLIQPAYLPEKFEAGTLNYLGIAGLRAALKYMHSKRERVVAKEMELTAYLMQELNKIDGITIYGTQEIDKKVPVVSFNLKGYLANKLAGVLDDQYHILTRPGLHCAPLVHKTIGSYPTGTVRVSLGMANTRDQIDILLDALSHLS